MAAGMESKCLRCPPPLFLHIAEVERLEFNFKAKPDRKKGGSQMDFQFVLGLHPGRTNGGPLTANDQAVLTCLCQCPLKSTDAPRHIASAAALRVRSPLATRRLRAHASQSVVARLQDRGASAPASGDELSEFVLRRVQQPLQVTEPDHFGARHQLVVSAPACGF